MPSTEEYLSAIDEAKQSGKSIDIDFNTLPADVDTMSINKALSINLPQEYADNINIAAQNKKVISLNYAQISNSNKKESPNIFKDLYNKKVAEIKQIPDDIFHGMGRQIADILSPPPNISRPVDTLRAPTVQEEFNKMVIPQLRSTPATGQLTIDEPSLSVEFRKGVESVFGLEGLREKDDSIKNIPEKIFNIGGRIAGTIAQIEMLNPIIGIPIANKIKNILGPTTLLNPTAGRAIVKGISQATVWGVRGMLEETGKQIVNQELDSKNIAKEGLLEAPFGLLTAVGGASANTLIRELGTGTAFSGYTVFEKLARNGELKKEDIPDILTSFGVGFLSTMIGAKKTSGIMKGQEWEDFALQEMKVKLETRNPNFSKQDIDTTAKMLLWSVKLPTKPAIVQEINSATSSEALKDIFNKYGIVEAKDLKSVQDGIKSMSPEVVNEMKTQFPKFSSIIDTLRSSVGKTTIETTIQPKQVAPEAKIEANPVQPIVTPQPQVELKPQVIPTSEQVKPTAVFKAWQKGVNPGEEFPLFDIVDPQNITKNDKITVSVGRLQELGIEVPEYPKFEEVSKTVKPTVVNTTEPSVSIEQLNQNPKLADYVIQKPEIHTADVFQKAQEIKSQEALQSEQFQVAKSGAGKVERFSGLAKVPEGYFTDGQVLIKGETPKNIKYDTTKPEITDVNQLETILNIKTNPAKFVQYEWSDAEYGTGISDRPIAALPSMKEGEHNVRVIFKSGNKDYAYNQFKFNAIRNRFPNAIYKISDNGILIASQDNKPMAALINIKNIEPIRMAEEADNELQKEMKDGKLTETDISSQYNESEKGEILSNIEKEGKGTEQPVSKGNVEPQAKLERPVHINPSVKPKTGAQSGEQKKSDIKEQPFIEEAQEFEGTRPLREVENLVEQAPDSINNSDKYDIYFDREIDEEQARNVLLNLANTLGVKVRFTASAKLWGSARTKDEKVWWVVVNEINNVPTLNHEMGHILSFRFAGDLRGIDGFFHDSTNVSDYLNIKFDKKKESILRKELNEVSHYVDPYDEKLSKGKTAYRHRHSELIQAGYQLLLAQPKKLQQLAPTFFNDLKNTVLQTELFKKLLGREFDVNTPYLPQAREERENIAVNFIKSFDKVIPDEGVNVEKPNNIILDKSKKVRFLLSLPLWSGINEPKFEAVYKPFKDSDYEFNGLVKKEFGKPEDFMDILKLPKLSKDKIADALYMGNLRGNNKVWSFDEAKNTFHMSVDEYDKYITIKTLAERITHYIVEARKVSTGFYDLDSTEQTIKLAEINDMIKKYKGYIPLSRTFGSWFLYGEIQTPELKNPKPYFARFESKNEAIKMGNLLNKAGYTGLTVYPFKNLPVSFYNNFRHFSMDEIESLLKEVSSNLPSIQTEKSAINKFIGAAEDFIRKTKGYSNLMRREYVSGYEWTVENALKTIVDRLEKSIKKYTNAKAFRGANKALSEINPKSEPQLYDTAKEYIDNYNSMNDDELRMFRRGIAMYVLSFRMSLILQDMLSPLKTTYPEISNYVPEGEIEKIFVSSIAKTFQYLFTKSASQDMKKNLERASNEGLLNAPYTESVYGEKATKKQFFELSPIEKVGTLTTEFFELFGKIGETYRRTNAAINALQIAKYLGLPEDDTYEFMKSFTEKTQGRFGTLNLPSIIDQSGKLKPVVKTAVLFKQYAWHEIQLFLNKVLGGRVGPGGKVLPGGVETRNKLGASLRYIIMSFLLTGFMGFAGMSMIDLILKKFGIDIRLGTRHLLGKDKQAVADVIIYGMPTLAGANLSRMIGIGDFIMPSKDPLDPFLGAGYGQVKRLLQGIKYFQQGDTKKAILSITPQQIANPFLAYQMSKEGLQISGVKSKAPISREDILFKAGGITSTAIAREYERMEAEKAIKAKKSRIQSNFTYRLMNAKTKNNKIEESKIIDEIHKYNGSIPKERVAERINIRTVYKNANKKVHDKKFGRKPSKYETREIYSTGD